MGIGGMDLTEGGSWLYPVPKLDPQDEPHPQIRRIPHSKPTPTQLNHAITQGNRGDLAYETRSLGSQHLHFRGLWNPEGILDHAGITALELHHPGHSFHAPALG